MKTLFYLFVLFFANTLYSQNAPLERDTANEAIWFEMMHDPSANFFETQRAFYLYWQSRPITRGSGYNVFKRWEYLTKRYIDENGWIQRTNQVDNSAEPSINLKMTNVSQLYGFDSAYSCEKDSNWVEIGPFDIVDAGRINTIAFHPTDSNIIYAGAPSGGIWKTINGGKSWKVLPGYLPSLGVSAIAIDSKNPDIMYIGLGDPDSYDSPSLGIFKTINGGDSWFPINNGIGQWQNTVFNLLIDPINPNIVLASVNGGIYRTVNGGALWKSSGAFLSRDLVVNPIDRRYVYATSTGYFYKSSDSGKTFTKVTKGMDGFGTHFVIGVTEADPSYVYLLECDSREMTKFYRSTNYGDSFTVMINGDQFNLMSLNLNGSIGSGQASFCMDIAVSPTNKNEVYVGGINIFYTKDGGKNWDYSAYWRGYDIKYVHADIHALEFHPLTRKLYAGSDGGIFVKKGLGWQPLSNGLGVYQTYRISTCDNGTLQAGFQDNGTLYSPLDSRLFRNTTGGDGMDNAINYQNPSLRYTSMQNGVILKSGNEIAKMGLNGINEPGDWLTPFILVEGRQDIMLAGFYNIWRSSRLDSSKIVFTNICKGPATSSSKYVSDIECSPANNNLVFFTRGGGTIYRTTNALSNSPDWVSKTVNGNILDIQCDYKNQNKVYVASSKRVYISTDMGNNWTNYSDSLPDVNINCIAIDSSSEIGGIYCGTSKGVFYRDKNMTHWVKYYNGLPENVEILDLDISYNKNDFSLSRLYAGTYGRGLWQAPLMTYSIPVPSERFAISKTRMCISDILSCADSTKGLYLKHQWLIEPESHVLMEPDSISQKVNVKFSKAGRYKIRKNVRNCLYMDSAYNDNFIVYDELKSSPCHSKVTDSALSKDFGISFAYINGYTRFSNGTYYGGSYEDLTCSPLISIKRNEKLKLSIRTHSSIAEYVKVYIDFNNDGQFSESTELVMSDRDVSHIDSFSFPADAVCNVPLRMRLMSDYNWISNACSDLQYGQTEDYSIIIEYEQADFICNKSTICTNEKVTFLDSSVGIYNSYSWNFGEGAIPKTAIGKGPHTVQYTNSGKKDVYLVLNNGVKSLKNNFLNVVSGNKDTIGTNKSTANYCSGQSIEIKSRNGSSILTNYRWFKNGLLIDTISNELSIHSGSESDAGDYFLITNNECIQDTSNTVKIVIHKSPAASIEINKTSACVDSADFIFCNLTAFLDSLKSRWFISDGRTFVDSCFLVSFEKPGVFNAKLVVKTNNCIDSVEKTIEVHPLPSPLFTAKKTGSSSYQFSPIDSTGLRYTWYFGDGDTSHAMRPLHTFTNQTDYRIALELISSNGCYDSLQMLLFDLQVSTNDVSKINLFSLFPNPTFGELRLYLNLEGPEIIQLELLTLEGKRIDTLLNKYVEESNVLYHFNLFEYRLESGLYIARIKVGTQVYNLKLCIL